jgi:hypothetical protein
MSHVSRRELCQIVMVVAALVRPAPVRAQVLNALSNPGFEAGMSSWSTDHATLRARDPVPRSGGAYLFGASDGSAGSYTFQTVGLPQLGLTDAQVDAGAAAVRYGGWQSGWHDQSDSGRIEVRCLGTDGAVLSTSDLGWFYSNNSWFERSGTTRLPTGTRAVTYGFYARRAQGTNTDAYLDDAFLGTCPADFDGNGAVMIQDLLAFLGAYAAGDARADVNLDGLLTVADFLAFLSAYAAGC